MTHKIYINAYFIIYLHLFLSLSLLRVSSPHMPAVGSVALLAILRGPQQPENKIL